MTTPRYPLIHREIVPRSPPKIPRPPLSRTFGEASATVIGAGDVPVPASPGALVSISDVRQYVAAIDQSVSDLDEDRYEDLIWNDPDVLDAAAKTFDLAFPSKAAELRADATTLRARMVGRSATQIQAEKEWSALWRVFVAKWEAEKKYIGYPGSMAAWSTGQWFKIKDLHVELNQFYDTFSHLGYKPRSAKKETVLPSFIPDVTSPFGLPSFTAMLPWLIGGAVIIGGIVVYQQVRPFLSSPKAA